MKFLAIFFSVVITYLWKQDLDRINDRWFFRLREFIENNAPGANKENFRGWFTVFLITYVIPLSLLASLLWLFSGFMFGVVSLFIHIFVLLMVFDRIQPGMMAKDFLRFWDEGDLAACQRYLEQELGCTDLPVSEDINAMKNTFNRLYVYRCFEKMFVTLTWYILAGPLGVIFAYISYQLRYSVLIDSDSPELEPVNNIIQLLEWLPLRLLGLTLSLVGNFEACFRRVRLAGLSVNINSAQTVYEFTQCALGKDAPTDQSGKGSSIDDVSDDDVHISAFKQRVSAEIEALQGLMQRCQFTWLTLIALVTVMGFQL